MVTHGGLFYVVYCITDERWVIDGVIKKGLLSASTLWEREKGIPPNGGEGKGIPPNTVKK